MSEDRAANAALAAPGHNVLAGRSFQAWTVRPYMDADAESVGRLIAETYSKFNLLFAAPEELKKLLGPFQYAWSVEPAHREAIARTISAPLVFVAEEEGEIVGVLRGRKERLASLFVRGDHHRRGIGRKLVETFEQECICQGMGLIRVAATLYAIPFYTALGYRMTTGVRNGWSFEGTGLQYQPMKKMLPTTSLHATGEVSRVR